MRYQFQVWASFYQILSRSEKVIRMSIQPDEGIEVFLAQSNITISVAADESILSRVLEAGIEVEYFCEDGMCGLCSAEIISGEVDHQDSVLSIEERESGKVMQLCVSRPKLGQKLILNL